MKKTKKNTTTAEVRKDPKGRKLEKNELYDAKTGRYRYQYTDAKGNRQQIYSWTLTAKDTVPAGKRQKKGESLREKKAKVLAELVNQLDTTKGNMTVLELAQIHINNKWNDVRETTRNGYRTNQKLLMNDPFGKRKIKDITEQDALDWFDRLNKPPKNSDGTFKSRPKGYSSLHTLRGILRPAFETARKNRWVLDNPFSFSLSKKRYGGVQTREALTKADMRRFLDFLRTDKHFKRYFYGVYILFSTGLRVSEFCGLVPDDIDFENHVIHVCRQLLRLHDGDDMLLYLEEPKTEFGKRDVPMTADIETAFREVIAIRPEVDEVTVYSVDKKMEATGFLWIDKDGHYEVAQHWENHLRWARQKFNKQFKEEMPQVTPHVCRHTFCSNMASLGMSPKTLQIIMGHASIEVTLNVYTHLEAGDIKSEFNRVVGTSDRYNFYPLDRTPAIVSLADDSPDDEGEPDMDWEPDEDD